MFLRINKNNGDSSVLECDAVHFSDDEIEKDAKVVTVEKGNNRFNLYFNTNGYTEIYLMNNDGKTIDSYRWSEDKANPATEEEKTN